MVGLTKTAGDIDRKGNITRLNAPSWLAILWNYMYSSQSVVVHVGASGWKKITTSEKVWEIRISFDVRQYTVNMITSTCIHGVVYEKLSINTYMKEISWILWPVSAILRFICTLRFCRAVYLLCSCRHFQAFLGYAELFFCSPKYFCSMLSFFCSPKYFSSTLSFFFCSPKNFSSMLSFFSALPSIFLLC